MPSGGARVNAGRPAGGIAQARRILLRAIQRGLAKAAIERGLDPDGTRAEDDLALDAASRIVGDMVIAGQGRDVLVLWAQVAPARDDPREPPSGGLSEALRRLPGVGRIFDADGADRSLDADEQIDVPSDSEPCEQGPTDSASVGAMNCETGEIVQPFFAPQKLLPGFVPSEPPKKSRGNIGLTEASLMPRGQRACIVELDGALIEFAPVASLAAKRHVNGERAPRAGGAGEVAGPPTPPPPPL